MAMPEIYPVHAPEPRALLLWDGTSYHVAACDLDGNLCLAAGGVNLQQYVDKWRFTGAGSAGSGGIIVDAPTLSSPELVVVQDAACWLSAGTAASMYISVWDGVTQFIVAYLKSPAVQVAITLPSPLVLAEGECLRFNASAVGAGTILQGRAVGYYART